MYEALFNLFKGKNGYMNLSQFITAIEEYVRKRDIIVINKNDDWDCILSPDDKCHYYSTDNKIILSDGYLYDLGHEYKGTHESDDWCIFCGEPKERK